MPNYRLPIPDVTASCPNHGEYVDPNEQTESRKDNVVFLQFMREVSAEHLHEVDSVGWYEYIHAERSQEVTAEHHLLCGRVFIHLVKTIHDR